MKHTHNHIPLLILSIAVTATVISLYVYMLYATSASVRQANLARDIVLAEKANQSQAQSVSLLASSTVALRGRLGSFFVPAQDIVSFITALESIGPQSGSKTSIASIDANPLESAPIGTVGIVRAHINADGSWSSVMRALALYELMPYAISIDHLSLTLSGMAQAHSVWSLSFDINAPELVTKPISQ
jgi:hypothetical protein